jgi:hypothetical protein
MAHWMLTCPKCLASFRHSEVAEATAEDYFLPLRPQFPEDGSDIECPDCGHFATYQATDLTYALGSET